MNVIETEFDWQSELVNRQDTFYLIVHHAQATNCTVKDVHIWHTLENNWAGIGYHYFISKNGVIYQGRQEQKVGAHAKGYNHNSIGICLEGNYIQEKINNTTKESLIKLCVDIKIRYPKIKILRHLDINQTSCPGEIGWVDILGKIENKFNKSKNISLQDKITTLEDKVSNLQKSNSKIFQILRKNNLDLR